MRFLRRIEGGVDEELTLEMFVGGMQSEFMCENNHYEWLCMLIGHGTKIVGSTHMYWMEWNDD